jgi:simple sugar transport system permease protein
MEAIYDIPVIGLLIQFVLYLAGHLPDIGHIIVASAVPIALGALCGFMNERSGVVNIGIEGMMLTAAFVAWWVAALVHAVIPADPLPGPFGISPALLVGLVAAIAAACAVSAVHAWLSISIRADQIISGMIINIFAFGITGYLIQLISENPPATAGSFSKLGLPFLTNLPVVGWLFKSFLAVGPIALTMVISVVLLQLLLHRSRWGLRTKAVGEHPKAAETLGIDVIKLRYRNVILGGVFAGLAGAYFTIEFGSNFTSNMTNGRGYIALAALIIGRYTPLGSFGAALLFSLAFAVQRLIQFAPPEGQLGDILGSIPFAFYEALPYLITIIVLAGVVGRSIPPAADGQPYERESKAA